MGLSVMASRLVEGRGERGQKSCQPQHCILLSCWTQGQAGSERLGTTISLVSSSQVRTASWSMLGIYQTIRHCHSHLVIINFTVSYQVSSECFNKSKTD